MERCQYIESVPDLCAPNLETLDISYCENLIEIHDSIGLLDKLEWLFLRHCMKLQILPSTLKVNKSFELQNCPRIEKIPDVMPKMKCVAGYYVYDSNIRESPSSLRYLTEQIIGLKILKCENLGNFLKCEEIDTPIFNCFRIPKYSGISQLECYGGILFDLDFFMKDDFFPALRYIKIDDCNIVSIPECIFRLSRLEEIYIRKCKELREIQNPRLPQSISRVIIEKCPSFLPQSSSRLLNEVRSLSLIIK